MRLPCKILIVEDNAVDRALFRTHLAGSKRYSFEFAEEERGSAALIRCRQFEPDCVLLDLNLPDMSGLEFLEELSRTGASTPVIVATAFGNEQIAVQAMKCGAADYVVKSSISPEALVHSVENVIERRQLQIELEAAIGREQAARTIAEHSEQRYRILTETIPQVVWSASHPDGAFDQVTKRWVETIGTPVETALGWGWINSIHPDDRDRISNAWRGALSKGAPFESGCRFGAQQTGYRWNLIRAVPQLQSGTVVRWVGTLTDIEDRGRAEQAMYQQQKLESIGLIAGGIAHDFNNLLVGILGGVSYALDVLPPSQQVRPMLEIAKGAAERAALLTRQMLAYAGKGRFIVEHVNLSELVRSTCDLIQAAIPKTIRLHIEAPHDVPPIESDPSQIQQVIMNLILNAAEAIEEEGAGVVTVRIGELEIRDGDVTADVRPGRYAVLEVIDTGCGMSEDTKARIFEPFFTTKFTGRGLGLAAVTGIVRSAKGAIEVRSAPGQGTTFRVLFSTVPSDRKMEKAAEVGPPQSATGVVLVVDDQETVLHTARALLERAGHTVHTASGGKQAVAHLQSAPNRYDLVLLDMNMPDLSGEETLQQIREINPSLPVAVCSGYTEIEMAHRFAGQTVSGFVQKPFTSRALADKAAELIGLRRANCRAFARGAT